LDNLITARFQIITVMNKRAIISSRASGNNSEQEEKRGFEAKNGVLLQFFAVAAMIVAVKWIIAEVQWMIY